MKRFLVSTLAVGALLLAGTAAAEPAFTAGKPSVSAQLNYGFFTGDGDLNPYGFGLGAKGGYTLDSNIYIGGAFDYYFGEDPVNIWALQGQVGYDIGVAPNVVVRPNLGIGLTNFKAEVCILSRCESNSETKFSLSPGVQGLYSLESFYLTADARYHAVFDGEDVNVNGIILGVGGGLTF